LKGGVNKKEKRHTPKGVQQSLQRVIERSKKGLARFDNEAIGDLLVSFSSQARGGGKPICGGLS